MISKAQIKAIRLLQQKKHREEEKLFIAEGIKVVNELLNSKFKAKEIFATKQFQISSSKFQIEEITEKELAQISLLSTPNEVLGVFEIPDFKFNSDFLQNELSIAIDDIRDPGNLGTIIRIADWFGIKNIICSENCVDVFNPKAVQATMGSIARVDVHYLNLQDFFLKLKNTIPIYAAVMNGKNIYSETLPKHAIILIGNESKGISEDILKFSSHKISIPSFSSKADSLNAAVASAIICSEFKRR